MGKQQPLLIVPIVFDLYDYDTESPALSWLFEVYINFCLNNKHPVIAQENYFKKNLNPLDETYRIERLNPKQDVNKEKKTFLKYSIKNSETQEIIGKSKSRFKAEIDFISKINSTYESVIEKRLDKIEKDYGKKVDAVMTWYWNESLNQIAKRRGFKIIQGELSSIRNIPTNKSYNTTLGYFQFSNKFDPNYCKKIYEEFLNSYQKEDLLVFSREELLALFLNTEDIDYIKKIKDPPKYEMGISPPPSEYSLYDVYENKDSNTSFKKIDKIFDPTEISVRHRTTSKWGAGNKLWDIDHSIKPIYWVCDCKSVLSYVSNIAFDAMMFGRTSYILTPNMPFYFKSVTSLNWKDESIVDSLFLNFIVFGYFTHWNLMFDQEYIEWRLSNPSITEIYKRNQNYVLELFGIKNRKGISLASLLKNLHHLDNSHIKDICTYSPYIEKKIMSLRIFDSEENLNVFCSISMSRIEEVNKLLIPSLQNQLSIKNINLYLINYKADNKITIQDFIRKDKIKMKVLNPKKSVGFGEAHNYAFKTVKPKGNFLIINPDIFLDRECIIEMIKVFDKKTGLVEARQLPFIHPKDGGQTGIFETNWASGCCLLINSKFFKKIGGFDTNYWMYLEDVDLSWKSWINGYRVIQNSQAIVYHYTGAYFKYSYNNYELEHFWSIRNFLYISYVYFKEKGLKQAIKLLDKQGLDLKLKNKAKLNFKNLRTSNTIKHVEVPSKLKERIKIFDFNKFSEYPK